MAKVSRGEGEIKSKFHEQAALLLAACKNFDEGFESAALSIAVCLRTIFHDTQNSKSALSLIGKKDIKMLDSAIYTGDDLNLGLLLKQYSTPYKIKYSVPDTEKHRMKYLPFCHSLTSFEKWKSAKKRWITIEE